MRIETQTFIFEAPASRVFDFLSDVENIPLWAIHFCKGLRREGGRHVVTTPAGDVFFRLDSDASTGVVDFIAGPDEDHPRRWPSRVVPLETNRTLWLFSAIQTPGQPDTDFEDQCRLLAEEGEVLRRHVEPARAKA